jgi:hypothetical protein
MKTGTLGPYRWAEFSNETPELLIPDVVRGIGVHLLGLRGVNVSWDSGLLHPSDPGLPAGWHYQGAYAISPPITQALLESWPHSGCGFDEWYFFRDVPALFNLNAFCNYLGMSLERAAEVPFPGGISLSDQLDRCQPDVVVGQGYNIFVISAQGEIIESFAELAREA